MKRRLILPAEPPPTKPNLKRIAAFKAHLTRYQTALLRWERRFDRAYNEMRKNRKKIRYYMQQLAKEAPPKS